MPRRTREPEVRIGISGWTYAPWRGDFYPPGLPHRAELGYASTHLSSIEINGTFYAMQKPSSFVKWREETPEDFVFAIKGGRYITHVKRLVGAEVALANFFATGVLSLGAKLGPILWQLPPNFQFDADKLGAFFDVLPRTTTAAIELAEQRDDKLPEDRVNSRRRRRPPAATCTRSSASELSGGRGSLAVEGERYCLRRCRQCR